MLRILILLNNPILASRSPNCANWYGSPTVDVASEHRIGEASCCVVLDRAHSQDLCQRAESIAITEKQPVVEESQV